MKLAFPALTDEKPDVIMGFLMKEFFTNIRRPDFARQESVRPLHKIVADHGAHRGTIGQRCNVIMVPGDTQTRVSLRGEQVVPLTEPFDIAVGCGLNLVATDRESVLTDAGAPSENHLIICPGALGVQSECAQESLAVTACQRRAGRGYAVPFLRWSSIRGFGVVRAQDRGRDRKSV